MGYNIAEKIIKAHLLGESMKEGEEVALRIDQTLTQDATGTLSYLEFEAMGIDRVKTEKSLAYIDHNTLQTGFENADDQRYIQSACRKYGIYFSRAGNGICHQVHLERFGIPGKTLLGSDSHTPTGGALGMLAMGAGGLDVAVAMGGGPYSIIMPKVIKIEITGKLKPFVSAKDISLEILRILSVKGGVGRIIEWGGEGLKSLSVPERATIANMGAELGALSTVFPSDEKTREFLKAQGREQDYSPIFADPDAKYERVISLDLGDLEPLIACPPMPDNVVTVKSLAGMKVDQVCIGSCTNSSLFDLLKVASILKGRVISPSVSLSLSPGSRQVLLMLSDCGALSDLISAGARLLECACGPCIGMGFSPRSKGVSLRTFNRNFEGRSGTADAKLYLVSPETASAAALTGVIIDPRDLGIPLPEIKLPSTFPIDDRLILPPADPEEAKHLKVIKGPNIKPIPEAEPLPDRVEAVLTLKVGDNISTDHIMPAGAKILPYRSNIPKLSQFCFAVYDKDFQKRAKEAGQSILVGGENYGQGSSREHAALVPRYLGVRAIAAKSFSRIHQSNLINAGILPMTFQNPKDYDRLSQGETLALTGIHKGLSSGKMTLHAKDCDILLLCSFSEKQQAILLAGGLLNFIKRGKNERQIH